MLSIKIKDESLQLLPQRALFRPSNSTLYIADTHWGKDETFRAHYIPLPKGSLQESLNRLSEALTITSAHRLVILGDLLHTSHSLSLAVIEAIHYWRNHHHDLQIMLVEGNHDRGVAELPPEWRIDRCPNDNDDGIALRHKPSANPDTFSFCGHLHPTWTIRGLAKQEINVPCFLQTENNLIFPAFSLFSGSTVYTIQNIQHIYAIASTQVFKVR